ACRSRSLFAPIARQLRSDLRALMSEFTPPLNGAPQTIAYFSMEICLEQNLPTYSGGLGVLAGDTLRSAADLGVPMVAVALAHRSGYLVQHLDPAGKQTETPAIWHPEQILEACEPVVTVEIEGRPVRVRAWRDEVKGHGGHVVPVLDRKSTRLNSSHVKLSYAVFCVKT